MTITFSERADLLCETLRDIEHQAEEGDQLFYCAYLLGLLGLHSSADGEGQEAFDQAFTKTLLDTLESEALTSQDQKQILALWQQTCDKV